MNNLVQILLILLLVLLLIGMLPAWSYSAAWGYYPSGGIGLLLLIVLVIALINSSGPRRLTK